MPHWLSVSTATITALNRFFFKAAVWIMAVVVPVMLYEVVARYFFNAPTTWGMELAILLFGPYFLLGGPYLLHLKGHVALDLVKQRLSPKWQRRMDLVNYPMIIVFCGILIYFSVPAAWSSWEYKETSFSAWNPPIWPIKAMVPLALLLMLLQAVVEFLATVFAEPATDESLRERGQS